jgi:hypothetical protein
MVGGAGGDLLPFQVTITVSQDIPPNNSNLIVPLQTISLNAGGKYQWERKFNEKHTDSAQFTTDPDGHVTRWTVGGGAHDHRVFYTEDEVGFVQDAVRFKCGTAMGTFDPGKWKQKEQAFPPRTGTAMRQFGVSRRVHDGRLQ